VVTGALESQPQLEAHLKLLLAAVVAEQRHLVRLKVSVVQAAAVTEQRHLVMAHLQAIILAVEVAAVQQGLVQQVQAVMEVAE
jgi:hypothetical protein